MLFELSYLMVSLFWLKFTLWVLLPPKVVSKVRASAWSYFPGCRSEPSLTPLLPNRQCLEACCWTSRHLGVFSPAVFSPGGCGAACRLGPNLWRQSSHLLLSCCFECILAARSQRLSHKGVDSLWISSVLPEERHSSIKRARCEEGCPSAQSFFSISGLQLLHLSRAQTITTQGSGVPGINQRLVWWFDWIVLSL